MKGIDNEFFLETVPYFNLIEMAEACKETRSIGLCFGKPGAGKTAAAFRYSNWQNILKNFAVRNGVPVEPEATQKADTLYYQPSITVSAPRLRSELNQLNNKFETVISSAVSWTNPEKWAESIKRRPTKLIIVDEAYRLKYQALEELRDIHEACNVGVLLLADPGFERGIGRMWHFCVRIAYVEEFQVFTPSEVNQYIDHKVKEMNLPKPKEEVYSLIFWYSQGNPRNLGNLFMMISRILKINSDVVQELSREVVETAREMMLRGLNKTLSQAAN